MATAVVPHLEQGRFGYLKPKDVARLAEAYRFSEAAHAGQVRQSGDPYISHPLAVAEILADWHLDGADPDGGAAARRDRGHLGHQGRDLRHLRQAGGRAGRRRVQARQDRVPVRRGRAGRELPQDAARDGARRARHPDQARRPPAQHAHAGRGAAGQAQARGARDDGDLRADRQPPGPQHAVPRAAGARVLAPLPAALPGARQGDQGGARQPPRDDRHARSRR